MASEARVPGQIHPGGAKPPAGLAPERIVLPQGLCQSLPIDKENMTARQKIQAKIDSEKFFVPKKQDTKRFQPGQPAFKVCEHLYTTYYGSWLSKP